MDNAPAPKADAVLIPTTYAGGPGPDRLARVTEEFAPVLGAARVEMQHCGVGRMLLTRKAHDHRYFGTFHPRAGRDRFAWVDRGDGVMLGTYIEGANDPT